MGRVVALLKRRLRKSFERDRASEGYVEALSRSLWPWRESKLLTLVCLLALLDYGSTYAFLELSGKTHIYEGGLLADWALRTAGFKGLLFVDVAAASALLLAAVSIRLVYSKFGFKGFARTAFVILLLPYVVATIAAVFNNIALTFI